jgi:hypothetical protein
MTELTPTAAEPTALLARRQRPALGASLPAGFPNWTAGIGTLRAFTRHGADCCVTSPRIPPTRAFERSTWDAPPHWRARAQGAVQAALDHHAIRDQHSNRPPRIPKCTLPRRNLVNTRPISNFAKRAVPAVLGSALVVTALSAAPASAASSGYVYSTNRGSEGWYYHGSERVWANDIKADGYAAVTQVFHRDGRLLVTVRDTGVRNGGSWKKPTLFAGTKKIRACLQKGNAKPVKCGAKKAWVVD